MKNAIYYLLLVGVPFLGLLAILEAGGRIVPPRAIGGVWDVELGDAEAGPGCPALVFDGNPREMRVSQSGLRANVVLNDRARSDFDIEIRGDSVSGLVPGSERGGCASGSVLRAGVRTEMGLETMEGELRAIDCAGCPAMLLRATRRPGAVVR